MPRPKLTKLPFLTPVLLIWRDAILDPSQDLSHEDPDSVQRFGGLVICEDIGFYVRHTRDEYVIAHSRSPDLSGARHATTIPTGWILEARPLASAQPPPPPKPVVAV